MASSNAKAATAKLADDKDSKTKDSSKQPAVKGNGDSKGKSNNAKAPTDTAGKDSKQSKTQNDNNNNDSSPTRGAQGNGKDGKDSKQANGKDSKQANGKDSKQANGKDSKPNEKDSKPNEKDSKPNEKDSKPNGKDSKQANGVQGNGKDSKQPNGATQSNGYRDTQPTNGSQRNGQKTSNNKTHPNRAGGDGSHMQTSPYTDGPMTAVKQATLLNYHLAIEDSVDIDKIWDVMQPVFDDDEQEEIQTQGNKKAEMKRLLDILPYKEDSAFDTLVRALRPEYKWLSVRLQQGVDEEERRVNKMGKGVRRKIALALLTARISERQKDGILDRVTEVVEQEMTHNTHRISIPDHRTEAQLEEEHRQLQEIIRDEIDPLLFGDGPNSARDNYDDDHQHLHEDTISILREKVEELQILRQCYAALNITKATSILPSLLLQRIEEVKTDIKILRREKHESQVEASRLREESLETQRTLSRLEERNRSLELDRKTLESDRQWLEDCLRKHQEGKRDAERDFTKADEENRKLRAELQLNLDKVSDLSLRNRSLDDQNAKLTRDNVKLSSTNSRLRRDSRLNNNGVGHVAAVRADNKKLASDRQQLKREVQQVENERRRLVIKTQKLEAENRNLREQKRRLTSDKKRTIEENRSLKREAKRLVIGPYSPLPPITESRRESLANGNDVSPDDVSQTSRRSQRSLHRSQESVRRGGGGGDGGGGDGGVRHYYERSRNRQPRNRTKSPWNKYKTEPNKKTLPRGRGEITDRRKKKQEEKGAEVGAEGDGNGRQAPSYMKATNSSRKHEYLEEEEESTRANQSPRRAAAWK